MAHTIVVSASAAESAAMQYIAPYSGCAMGEYFRDKGEDALIIYDDLTKQAWAYRQVSLLLRRPPGREAYPGDVFYLHSRLLERAARINADEVEKLTNGQVKGQTGSLTALPIIERGERATEMMKQKQYSTMSVAEMGLSLFAVNEGYLDDIEVNKVVDFEQALQSHMKSQQSDLIEALNRDQAYDDDVADKLHAALKDFKTNGSW